MKKWKVKLTNKRIGYDPRGILVPLGVTREMDLCLEDDVKLKVGDPYTTAEGEWIITAIKSVKDVDDEE